jgi:hypothetical protein
LFDALRLIGRNQKRFPTFRERKGNKSVKLSLISKSLVPGVALLVATSAFAANKANKGSFDVFDPVTVSGHQLPPGQYKLTWEGTGPDVEAMILSGGKLVATVPAHLTDQSEAAPTNVTQTRQNDDGSKSMTQVDFAGKKYSLSFGNAPTTTESTSETGSQ